MGFKKAFGKECVATQSGTMPPEEVATLRREITTDVLDRVAFILQKMGAPTVDLANMIVKDQQSQHEDPKVSIERTPEPITPIAQNPTPETVNCGARNPKTTPEPVVKLHSF